MKRMVELLDRNRNVAVLCALAGIVVAVCVWGFQPNRDNAKNASVLANREGRSFSTAGLLQRV